MRSDARFRSRRRLTNSPNITMWQSPGYAGDTYFVYARDRIGAVFAPPLHHALDDPGCAADNLWSAGNFAFCQKNLQQVIQEPLPELRRSDAPMIPRQQSASFGLIQCMTDSEQREAGALLE